MRLSTLLAVTGVGIIASSSMAQFITVDDFSGGSPNLIISNDDSSDPMNDLADTIVFLAPGSPVGANDLTTDSAASNTIGGQRTVGVLFQDISGTPGGASGGAILAAVNNDPMSSFSQSTFMRLDAGQNIDDALFTITYDNYVDVDITNGLTLDTVRVNFVDLGTFALLPVTLTIDDGVNSFTDTVVLPIGSLSAGIIDFPLQPYVTAGVDVTSVDSMEFSFDNQAGADITLDLIQVIPEPATMALLGLGGLALLRRRRA